MPELEDEFFSLRTSPGELAEMWLTSLSRPASSRNRPALLARRRRTPRPRPAPPPRRDRPRRPTAPLGRTLTRSRGRSSQATPPLSRTFHMPAHRSTSRPAAAPPCRLLPSGNTRPAPPPARRGSAGPRLGHAVGPDSAAAAPREPGRGDPAPGRGSGRRASRRRRRDGAVLRAPRWQRAGARSFRSGVPGIAGAWPGARTRQLADARHSPEVTKPTGLVLGMRHEAFDSRASGAGRSHCLPTEGRSSALVVLPRTGLGQAVPNG